MDYINTALLIYFLVNFLFFVCKNRNKVLGLFEAYKQKLQ